jgi:hypothetical protein
MHFTQQKYFVQCSKICTLLSFYTSHEYTDSHIYCKKKTLHQLSSILCTPSVQICRLYWHFKIHSFFFCEGRFIVSSTASMYLDIYLYMSRYMLLIVNLDFSTQEV